MAQNLITTVAGGYNGGAVISVTLDNTQVFTSRALDTYNLNYNNLSGSFQCIDGTVNITVTPPPNSTSALTITYSGAVSKTLSIRPAGQNTSYGYNYSNTIVIGGDHHPTMTILSAFQGGFNCGGVVIPFLCCRVSVSTPLTDTYQLYNISPGDFFGQSMFSMTAGVVSAVGLGGAFGNISGYEIPSSVTYGSDEHYKYVWNECSGHLYYQGTLFGAAKTSWSSYPSGSAIGVVPVFIDDATNKIIVYTDPPGGSLDTPETLLYTGSNNVFGLTNSIGVPVATLWGYDPEIVVSVDSLQAKIIDAEYIIPSEDPYAPGGETGDDDTDGEGGKGDFDGTTDPIDFPDLPTVSAVDTKFVTIFNPTKAQLTSLAAYMWSPLFDLDTLKKLWADPMDCILGLTMVPFSVPNGGTGTVAIGNVSTGISMTKAGSQYVSIDCGSINVKEFWGGYLDYDPYTKFQIYLPYVGIKPLLADEIMGKSIHVKYHCDILTGACNCFVKCGGSVLYSFNGQCSTQIPISGNDWRNTISAAINIAGQAAGMYMTGGMTAPMGITSIAQSAVNGMKPTVEKSGSLSGTGGMLAIQKPYLIATRPKQAAAKNQNKFTGYPAFITRTLSSCSGYTEIYSCHLEKIPCTADELNEIENLLKAGVIL